MNRNREEGHDTIDPIIRLWIRLRDNDTCKICGRIYNPLLARIYPYKYFDRMEIDHIIPFSAFGRNSVDNYQLLCKKCNREKGAKLVLDKGE